MDVELFFLITFFNKISRCVTHPRTHIQNRRIRLIFKILRGIKTLKFDDISIMRPLHQTVIRTFPTVHVIPEGNLIRNTFNPFINI